MLLQNILKALLICTKEWLKMCNYQLITELLINQNLKYHVYQLPIRGKYCIYSAIINIPKETIININKISSNNNNVNF